jgi:S-disulfanyl-L-cysteine oxidoreductase SoxD
MTAKRLVIGFTGLLFLASLVAFALWRGDGSPRPVVFNNVVLPPLPSLSDSSVARGKELYAQQCAVCHGVNLEGTANWKDRLADGSLPPPPHDNTGHTWHHPDAVLLEIIREGGNPDFNSKMPAFGERLTDEEMMNILDYFKSTWGKREREFQWGVTVTNPE